MKNNKTAKKIKKKVNKPQDIQKKSGGVFKASFSGLVVYFVLALLASLCLSAAISGTPNPNMYILPCALGANLVCAAISGAVFNATSKMSALASGIINAVCIAAVTLLLSLMPIVNRQESGSLGKALLMVAITLGSLVGAAISAKMSAKPKKRAR